MKNLIFNDEELLLVNKFLNSDMSDTDRRSVAKILEKFGGDIDNLKSYVKWLYKYGGTGSKYGGSGGGGNSNNWNVLAYIDEEPLSTQYLVPEKTNNVYRLQVRISRPGSSTFTLKVTYKEDGKDSGVDYAKNIQLSAENNVWESNIKISKNGTLIINVQNNEDDEPKTLSTRCFLNNHDLDIAVVNKSLNKYSLFNDTLYFSNIESHNNQKELYICIYHKIYVDVKNIQLNVKILGNSTITLDPINLGDLGYNADSNQQYTIINLGELINIDTDLEDNIAGTYTISASLSYTLNVNKVFTKNITFAIIPNGLYIKLTPVIENSVIYRQQQENIDDIYLFNSGRVRVNLTAYNSENTSSITYNISKVIGDSDPINMIFNTNINNRGTHSIILSCDASPEHTTENKIIVETTNGIETKIFVYYIYINKSDNSLMWFEKEENTQDTYFRNDNTLKNTANYININKILEFNKNFNSNKYIALNSINNIDVFRIYELNQNINFDLTNGVIISFGIQYNLINQDNQKLIDLTFNDTTNKKVISIYQNKFVFNNNSYEIFIPKESNYVNTDFTKYHLLSISIRKIDVHSSNNRGAYELCFYMDGILEKTATEYFIKSSDDSPGSNKLYSIDLYKSNYSLNLLDVTYFNESDDQEYNDNTITQYYYKYYSNMSDSDELQTAIDNFKLFEDKIAPYFKEVDLFKNNVYSASVINIDLGDTNSSITNVLLGGDSHPYKYGVPIMILNFDNIDINEFFIDYFVKTYKEGELDTRTTKDINSVTWIDENNNVREINNQFTFTLQGSSTGQFKSKNFNLSAKSGDNEETVLWTPNFDTTKNEKNIYNEDINLSFLPENTFTFKTDAVDSTHSNNTSIGLFVNKNTRKFKYAASAQGLNGSIYTSYIKNCLIGIKVLVIFNFTIITEDGNNKNNYYYMGIYNLNLGRDSYLNLGYYNIKNVMDNLSDSDGEQIDLFDGNHNGFGVYTVPTQMYQPIPGLNVAEIQGGQTYFDFSQYDNKILFGDDQTEMMFGDFYPKDNNTIENRQRKIQHFVEGISAFGGAFFKNIGKNMSDSIDDKFGYLYGYNSFVTKDGKYYLSESNGSVPNYLHQFTLNESHKIIWKGQEGDIDLNAQESKWKNPQDANFNFNFETFIGVPHGENNDEITYYNNLDPNTLSYLLDYTSLVEYYTICMMQGLVDSVMKNLNIKSFGMQSPFYIAFYDMDTSNSRDNGGEYTSPFAFSNYWKNVNNENVVYNDFYPNKDLANGNWFEHRMDDIDDSTFNMDLIMDKDIMAKLPKGYDVPSSYLFSIAKYAKLFVGYDVLSNFTFDNRYKDVYDINPSYYWYKLRGGSNGITAKKFISEYFAKNTSNINEYLWNLSYRFKYLIKESTSFNANNIKPFHGRGINSLEDWLSKRYRILDAYLNIKETNIPYKRYDLSDNTWKNVIINNAERYDPKFTVVNGDNAINIQNNDVQILQSIFSDSNTGQNMKLPGTFVSFQIKALDFSPMYFTVAGKEYSFICIDNNETYVFNASNIVDSGVGELSYGFGGSVAWTNINNFNSLISNGQLTLSSNYLENIVVNGFSELKVLTLNNIKAVRKIEITSPNASCNIDLKNSNDTDNYPNLKEINLSGSKCKLSLNDVNVTNINLSNAICSGDDGNIKLENCNLLNVVNLNNFTGNEVQITRTWNKGDNKNLINDSHIKSLDITNDIYDNMSFEINNDDSIETIKLSGYTSIIINNCPKLRYITISENSNFKLKHLEIKGCNKLNSDDTENKISESQSSIIPISFNNNISSIDLSIFTELRELSLNNTIGFTNVQLNDNVILLESCFANTDIKTLTNNNSNQLAILGGHSIFKDSDYGLLMGKYFGILDTCSSLKDTFARTQNKQYESKNTSMFGFFDELVIYSYNNGIIERHTNTNDETLYFLKDISNIFYNQDITINGNVSDALALSGLFSRLTDVENISGAFYGNTHFNILLPSMISKMKNNNEIYLGMNASTINISNFINNLDKIYINTFYKLLPKIQGSFIGSIESPVTFTVIGADNKPIQEVSLRDFFGNGEIDLKKISVISGLNFNNDVIDFTNVFNILSNINRIEYSFGANGNNKAIGLNDCGLNGLQNLTIINSFKFRSVDTDIDLYHFLSWDNVILGPGVDSNLNHNLFVFDKYITQENFEILLSKYSYSIRNIDDDKKSIEYIFQQCTFINEIDGTYSNEFIIPSTIVNIRYINYAFRNIKMCTGIDNINGKEVINKGPVKLTNNTFPLGHNISYMDYAFSEINLASGLPANLFNLRKSIGDNYLDDTYKPQISSMKYCFANITFDSMSAPYWDASTEELQHALLKEPNGNYIHDFSGLENSNLYYCDTTNNAYSININKSNDNKLSIFSGFNKGSFNIYNKPLKNNASVNKYILPYDIFYGNKPNSYIEGCFSNSQFEGVLTPNLYNNKLNNRYNTSDTSGLRFANIKDVFNNLIVIPQKLNTDELYINDNDESISNVIKTNIYVFVPKYFINFNNVISIENAFTFEIALPNSYMNNGDHIMYYLMYDKSLNENVTSLNSLFNKKCYALCYDGQGVEYKQQISLGNNLFDIKFGYVIDDDIYLNAKNIAIEATTPNNDIREDDIVTRKNYDGINISNFNNQNVLLNGAFSSTLTDIISSNPIRIMYKKKNETSWSPYTYHLPSQAGWQANTPEVFNFGYPNRLLIMPNYTGAYDFMNLFISAYSTMSPFVFYNYQLNSSFRKTITNQYGDKITVPVINQYNVASVDTSKTITIYNSIYEGNKVNTDNEKYLDVNEIIEDPIILYWKRWIQSH